MVSKTSEHRGKRKVQELILNTNHWNILDWSLKKKDFPRKMGRRQLRSTGRHGHELSRREHGLLFSTVKVTKNKDNMQQSWGGPKETGWLNVRWDLRWGLGTPGTEKGHRAKSKKI